MSYITPCFISHGSPTFALDPHPIAQGWQTLTQHLTATPRAVLVISAHWQTPELRLSGGVDQSLPLLYDFYGFPQALYQLQWPVSGSAALAEDIRQALEVAGLTVKQEPLRPLDHGVWVPLRRLWPQGSPVPVLQLSLTYNDTAWHRRLGQALAPLAAQGVWIIGSGGLVHNLRQLNWMDADAAPDSWAEQFMQAMEPAIVADSPQLLNPQQLPYGPLAVANMDHYLPLVVARGVSAGQAEVWQRGWAYGCLDGWVVGFTA